MATITDRLGRFTGQIGPVVFRDGTGQSDDPDVLAYFHADSDRWDVTDEYDELEHLPAYDDPDDDPEPDPTDDPED